MNSLCFGNRAEDGARAAAQLSTFSQSTLLHDRPGARETGPTMLY
jgi:hypothetical protein